MSGLDPAPPLILIEPDLVQVIKPSSRLTAEEAEV